MTIEEAGNVLKCIVIDTEDLSAGVKRTQEKALDFTIKALEKQIPKKPIEKSPWVYHCPSCDSQDIEDVFIKKFNFCPDCGQALDWSDSND